MSTVDDIIEQTASRGGKSPGEANNSDAFEAFGLFRDYLDSKLCDLKKDISDQTLKLKRKAPSFRLESHRIQFEFNLDIQEGLERIASGVRQKDIDLCKDLISKLKKRNKLTNPPGAGLQSVNMKSPAYAVVTQRMTESLNELKQERLRKSSFLISLPQFKPIQIIMVLKKVLLISCLLTCLVPEPAFSLMVDQHGVEVGSISISRTTTSYSIRHLFLLWTYRALQTIVS